MILQITGSSIASNGGASGPIKLSQTDFEHYRVVFMDILINSQQLRLEPRPIGEGDSDRISLSSYDRTFCRAFGFCLRSHCSKRMGL